MNSMPRRPHFARQRFLLALLAHAGGRLTRMEAQKLLFLAHQDAGFAHYGFVPYLYGCYSFQAAADMRRLEDMGWIRLDEKEAVLLREPPRDILGLREEERLSRFMRGCWNLRGWKLVRHVYRRFPYAAIRSKMAKDLLDPREYRRVEEVRSRLKSTERLLFTLGYEGRSLEEYVNILINNDIRLLCDVRRNPLSRKFGFSKGSLARLLPGTGVAYHHLPGLGIEGEKRRNLRTVEDHAMLLRDYEATLAERSGDLRELLALVGHARRVALCCFERDPGLCHRSRISARLEADYGVSVVHL